MEKIEREALKEGMTFSAPVFFDDGKNMFLGERKPLTKQHLAVLSQWEVPYVITYGKELGPDDLADAENSDLLEDLEAEEI